MKKQRGKFKEGYFRLLIAFIVASLLLIGLKTFFEVKNLEKPVSYGVSFEPSYASFLGLDEKELYNQILTDLGVKNIRLNAYWDKIEPEPDKFDFRELDYYLDEAEKHGAKVVLAVGFKLPRWPECRMPKWLSFNDLPNLRERQLKMVSEVVRKYDRRSVVSFFQVENEPLLGFGICPKPDAKFLKKEVSMVRSLTKKPILLTDSGEGRLWVEPMKLSDVFGTTLYRKVYDRRIGYVYYPLPPSFYTLKSNIVRKFWAPNNSKTIVAELQGEIWADEKLTEIPVSEQAKKYPVADLENTVSFARKTGFDEFYLWGVEWWYFMAKNGHPEYLDYARKLF